MSVVLSKFTSIFGAYTGDALCLIGLGIISFIAVMYFGKGRVVALILTFYPAALLFKALPFHDKFLFAKEAKLLVLNEALIFLVLFVLLNIVVNKFVFMAGDFSEGGKVLKNILLSISLLITFMMIDYNVVNMDALHDFSPKIDVLFSGEGKMFYNSLVSLGFLAFI